MAEKLDKKSLVCNKPRKTPTHRTKSHVVKACQNGKEKIIRFGLKVLVLPVNLNQVNRQNKKHVEKVLKLDMVKT